MLNSIHRDNRRRALVFKLEIKRLQYKILLNNASLPRDIRRYYRDKYNKLPRNSCSTRIRNRCILTARGNGVLGFCKLSRIRFRELASQGSILGVCKVSW